MRMQRLRRRLRTREERLNAESLRTAESTAFPGAAFLQRLEFVLDADAEADRVRAYATVDPRDRNRRKLQVRDLECFYGHRGSHPALRHLSPFEFFRHWEVVLLDFLPGGALGPLSHATLTPTRQARWD